MKILVSLILAVAFYVQASEWGTWSNADKQGAIEFMAKKFSETDKMCVNANMSVYADKDKIYFVFECTEKKIQL